MDVVLQRRIAAHTRSAIVHEQSADFHQSVSELFDMLDDEANASRARDLARQHREHALREWELATLSLTDANALACHPFDSVAQEMWTHDTEVDDARAFMRHR